MSTPAVEPPIKLVPTAASTLNVSVSPLTNPPSEHLKRPEPSEQAIQLPSTFSTFNPQSRPPVQFPVHQSPPGQHHKHQFRPQVTPLPVRSLSRSHHSSPSPSSSISPPRMSYGSQPQVQRLSLQHLAPQFPARRTPSNSGSASSASNPTNPGSISHSNSSSSGIVRVRRSSSRASSSSPTSYVALLRKQKATVWCDRSQAEDPRIVAAIRLAKERAEREVAQVPNHHHHGSHSHLAMTHGNSSLVTGPRITPPNGASSSTSSFTSGVRKIRHHGQKNQTVPFKGGNLAGTGVPVRLLSGELDDDDDVQNYGQQQYLSSTGGHQRHTSMTMQQPGAQNGMGKDDDWGIDASFYGAARPAGEDQYQYQHPHQHQHRRSSSGGSRVTLQPPGHGRTPSEGMGMLEEERTTGNFEPSEQQYLGRSDTISSEDDEREKEDELRRRGSVDDRTMTMSGVRLFVANPDIDD